MTRRIRHIVSVFLTVAVFAASFLYFSAPISAAGATLILSPSKGTYNVGSSFSVSVLVNSGGAGVNAAEATVNFSADILKVSSVSQNNSIFELWTTKPAFSNNAGTVNFGGGLTSSYSGSAGRLFTISFTALKTGTAKVSFSGVTVTAADGLGTNVYAGGSNASYVIADKPAAVETPVKVPDTQTKPSDSLFGDGANSTAASAPKENYNLPPAPEVTSPSHPSTDQWYSKNKAKFEWKTLPGVTGVSLMMTESSSSDPGTKSDGSAQNKEYSNVANGIHYFHVKLQNKDGWGKITHRKFMVDAEAPTEPKLTLDNGGDSTNPSPGLRILSIDRVSGLSKFKLSLNGANSEVAARDFNVEPYRFDKLLPGSYVIGVVAVDNAGNTSSSSLTFMIDPLRAPIITSIPQELVEGSDLTVRGSSFYPRATIQVYFSLNNGDPKHYDVKTDDKGDWNYNYNDGGRIKRGGYQVYAKVIDERGAESTMSNQVFLNVTKAGIIAAYGLFIIIILIFIIILLCLYIYMLKKNFKESLLEIKDEALESQRRITEVFSALHEEVEELMPFADNKAGLSETERRVKEKINEALNISEEFLVKEVEDVEKEIAAALGKKK